jgi:hypothetical protein
MSRSLTVKVDFFPATDATVANVVLAKHDEVHEKMKAAPHTRYGLHV